MLFVMLDVYGFLQNLGFSVACCSLCWMFMVSLQILGFGVACCSLCVGCFGFHHKFRSLVLRVVRYVCGCLWFPTNFRV
jgi:hypothetical protein